MSKWKTEVFRGNRSDGTYGDRIEMTCPDCGERQTRDVQDCKHCGPAVRCDTMDNEICCGGCGHLIPWDFADIVGHCPNPNETDCPEED